MEQIREGAVKTSLKVYNSQQQNEKDQIARPKDNRYDQYRRRDDSDNQDRLRDNKRSYRDYRDKEIIREKAHRNRDDSHDENIDSRNKFSSKQDDDRYDRRRKRRSSDSEDYHTYKKPRFQNDRIENPQSRYQEDKFEQRRQESSLPTIHQSRQKTEVHDPEYRLSSVQEPHQQNQELKNKPCVPQVQSKINIQNLPPMPHSIQKMQSLDNNEKQGKINKYEQKLGTSKPFSLEQLRQAAEQMENADETLDPFASVTVDKHFIYFPGMLPKPRRYQNKWRDATEDEMRRQFDNSKLDDGGNNFFEEFMKIADKNLMHNLNPTILSALQDDTKIKKKLYIPKNPGVNYIGLLIGPQGHYQKRLEEESNCKILIRGKGSQKQGSAPQPDDEDDQYVLIIGETAADIQKASQFVERILASDEQTREKIRKEQLSVAALLQQEQKMMAQQGKAQNLKPTLEDVYREAGLENKEVDETMMTPYGPPSALAYILPVPNDCVGLIIGKGGETIRQLQQESGAAIQVAIKEVQETGMRNVFIEASDDKYRKAKEMIDQIVRNQQQMVHKQHVFTPASQQPYNQNPYGGNPQMQQNLSGKQVVTIGESNPYKTAGNKHKILQFEILDRMVGFVIGKGAETLKNIAMKSNTKIFVYQKTNNSRGQAQDDIYSQTFDEQGNPTRIIEVLGASQLEQQIAQELIYEIIDNFQKQSKVGYNIGYQQGYVPNNNYNQSKRNRDFYHQDK